ncbi:PIN domain-containing protein [Fictibacillus fluitans]|uniref:PIN domain-containing protein n=1 Tax=Fictibacillus fluitans TaxID=3058422 RepID=A0ABT8HUJ3_9BACL|nr:PIN domain-containing protein [Fictibacillus sp. NE201]MDN4523937.1 PIN domain-containing protein [Fictibacillus sp. NE201]
MRLLIDTNTWANFEKGYPPVFHYLDKKIKDGYEPCINRMIQHELLSVYSYQNDHLVKAIRDEMIELCEDRVYEIDKETIILSAEIRRKARIINNTKIKAPDAIIAATAIIHDLILVSNNDKDFDWPSSFYGFKYENPVTDAENFRSFDRHFNAQIKSKNLED